MTIAILSSIWENDTARAQCTGQHVAQGVQSHAYAHAHVKRAASQKHWDIDVRVLVLYVRT